MRPSSYHRGRGRIFYFSPGHETYPVYHLPGVQTVLANAVRWAHNPAAATTAILIVGRLINWRNRWRPK